MNVKLNPTILIDDREPTALAQRWDFPECETVTRRLLTGDFSIDGLYQKKIITVEKKRTVSDLVGCLCRAGPKERFWDELRRLEEFKFPFVIACFSYEALMGWPHGCGIPPGRLSQIRTTPSLIQAKLIEVQLAFKTPFLFLGDKANDFVQNLFWELAESHRGMVQKNDHPPDQRRLPL